MIPSDPVSENLRLKEYIASLEDKLYELEETLDEIHRKEEKEAYEWMRADALLDSLREK